MASEAITPKKGNQREFQFRQITKDGFDWNYARSVISDGDGKIFKFKENWNQDCHICVEFYDETKASWTKVERKGEWPNWLMGYSTTLDPM